MDTNLKPTRKVTAGVLGGAVSVIGVWAFEQSTGVSVPNEVAQAVTLVCGFALGYVVTD